MDSLQNQKEQATNASQGYSSMYSSMAPGQYCWTSSTGQAAATWNSYGAESGHPSSSCHLYDGQKETSVILDVQGGPNGASHSSSSSSLVSQNASQEYSGYMSYPTSNNTYGYSTEAYQNYYYGYQQTTNVPSSHQAVAAQNPGVPYQPHSSFQNSSSSMDPTSYSVSYYNIGDHQTMVTYQSGNYNNTWDGGDPGSYPFHHYSNYASSDTNTAQINAAAPQNAQYYQHQYSHWPNYYGHTAPSVSCAPGTDVSSVNNSSVIGGTLQGASGDHYYSNCQPPPPGTTSWRRDSVSSLSSMQAKEDITSNNAKSAFENTTSTIQNHIEQVPPYFQKSFESNSLPNLADQQNTIYLQGPSVQLGSTNQITENFQPPLQMVQTSERRVCNMQIPPNPRITSALPVVTPKVNSEISSDTSASKPAYVSISNVKLTNKVSPQADPEAIVKEAFPPSLCAYVERSFARCKDDVQRTTNKMMMTEVITKAKSDGTLSSKNWDIEPLFPLSNTSLEIADQSTVISAAAILPLPKRSSGMRAKSRWEPLREEISVEKPPSISHGAKDTSWDHSKETENVVHERKNESTDNVSNGVNVSTSQQTLYKTPYMPFKKQRYNNSASVSENVVSSNNDDDQDLTKYYFSATVLADSPEERKRREHRFKRFEKGQEQQSESKTSASKSFGTGKYTRISNTLVLSRTFQNGPSKAVEDMDWDSLTIKGTCQEVEKRYLRLTSAPDPATVRPEDILEKALQMVQTSDKNYFHKCDQLKSIRQDLTVQRIQNELTVKVYETHARLALEAGDLSEYNQCQSQLKILYAIGISGNNMEFSAYSLLCVILHSNNKRDLLSSMSKLSAEAKENEAVKHALAVRRAVSSRNYVLFFRLYKEAPNLSTCLMDLYIERMRFQAVRCMSKSYRPTVPISYVAQLLGFSRKASDEKSDGNNLDGLEECEEWLKCHGASLNVDSNGDLQIDTKVTSSSLYMPEPGDAVAHGDANLAVDDFLARVSG